MKPNEPLGPQDLALVMSLVSVIFSIVVLILTKC